MENALKQTEKQVNICEERTIEVVTTEIKSLKQQALQTALVYAIEIGRRLEEAKLLLNHGEWQVWLTENVDISQSSANNFMKLYKEYGSGQDSIFGAELGNESLRNLSYTKALKLLALPAEERETVIAENDIASMSTKEIETLIKEKEEALKKAEKAEELEEALKDAEEKLRAYEETEADSSETTKKLEENIKELTESLQKAKENEKKAKQKLKDLKENPQISDDVMNRISAEAEEKAAEAQKKIYEEEIEKLKQKVNETEIERINAKNELNLANERVDSLKKQIQMSDPAVTEFKTLFNQVQNDIQSLLIALTKIESAEMKDKFKAAMKALSSKLTGE